jgi:hypothetical protein
MRVQIPAYTDHWMRGDRFGQVIRKYSVSVTGLAVERFRVKLDISGKLISVIADDCEVVS